jgi:enoyl-CoA hydratase/carnithine racemase
MSDGDVIVELGPISRITLNRPRQHNALSTAAGDELVAALTKIGRSPDVKVVVLAGAGPSFCSGDDRSEGANGRIPDYPWTNPYHSEHVEPFGVVRHGYYQCMSLIRRIPQAVIARVHGYCMGSAVDLMLACDFAVSDEEAKIQMVFGDRGITGGLAFLPHYLGLKQTMNVLFDPQPMSGRKAAELGLVTEAVPANELDERTDALAERLLVSAQQYYGYFGMMKEAVNRVMFPSLDEDIRTQVLSTRLSDFYRLTHPAAE